MSSPSSSDRVVGEPGEDGPRSDLPTPPSHALLRVDVLHVEAHVRPCCSAAARTVLLQTRELVASRGPPLHTGAPDSGRAHKVPQLNKQGAPCGPWGTPPGQKTTPIVSTGAQYHAPTSREGTAMKLGPGPKGV